ncbi:MAG: hypothetical protein AAEJ57_07045 [Opitutales bacterium]
MKTIPLFTLTLTSLFFVSGQGFCKPASAPLVPQLKLAGNENQPFAYAKTIALPKLLQKVTEMAQSVKPGQETAAIPAMIGLMLGDPSLASIDAKSPMSFFLFDDFEGDDPVFVMVGKLTKDSPIRKIMEEGGMAMVDKKGWTLATRTPELLTQVKDWSPLLTFAAKAPEGDVEFGGRLDPLRKEMPKVKNAMREGLTESPFEKDTRASLGKVMDVAMDELAAIDSMKIDLTLSKKEIIMRYKVEARQNSALSKLFSNKAGGNASAAQYLASGGWMSMVLDWDMEGFITYYKYLSGKLKGGFEGEFKELLEQFDASAADWIKAYGGQIATRYDLSGKEGAMNFVQVGSTELTLEELGKMIADYMALTQEMMDKIELFEEAGLKYKFKSGKGKPIKGTPTQRISVKMQADPALFPGGLPFSEMTYHFAVSDGHYVMASDRKELGQLLRAMKNKKPVKNSLAKTMPLQPGQMGRWSLDVGKYAEFVIGMSGVMDEESMQDLVNGIRALDLEPLTGSMSLGSGRFSADLHVPLKTIKEGIGFMEKAQAEATPQLPLEQ